MTTNTVAQAEAEFNPNGATPGQLRRLRQFIMTDVLDEDDRERMLQEIEDYSYSEATRALMGFVL